jgi:hypothetical protein
VTPDVDDKVVPRRRFVMILRDAITWKIAVGTTIILVIGLALIGVSFASWFPSVDKSWLAFSIRELGGGLVVAAIAGLLVQMFVERYRQQLSESLTQFVEKDVTHDLRDIRARIGEQTDALVQGSSSLDALRRTGVGQVWQSRGDALEAMKQDLEAHDLRSIRVIGISLNDFLRVDQHQNLHSVWKLISNYLRGDRKPESTLDVRVLVIDPNSYGALLRSFGEVRQDDDLAGRLDEDVTATARRLAGLKAEVAAQAAENPEVAVTFDFRLYRAAPTVFMVWTDKAAYMQPYYFWSKRQFEQSMPVMRFETAFGLEAMKSHFDLLWQFASVDGESWLKAHEIGLDRGSYESGMINLFTDPQKGYGRLCWLIEHAKERVYISGISLKSFFASGLLFAAVQRAIADPRIDVRILLLDPDGVQAKYRSFREHQFADHCGRQYYRYEDYTREPECHRQSTLAQDTRASIRHMQAIQQRGSANRFELKLYDTSPSCFLMIADDHALVEQYHYGKYIPTGSPEPLGTPPILGKDMAVVEFARTREDDLLIDLARARSSFDLVLDHFTFVFNACAKPCAPELAGLVGDIAGEPAIESENASSVGP